MQQKSICQDKIILTLLILKNNKKGPFSLTMTVNTFGDILVIKIEILSKNSISESLRDKQNIIYIYAYKFVNI